MGLSQNIVIQLHMFGAKRRLILKKSKSESYLHILIKIISYLYYWKEDLEVEPSLKMKKYKPDLVRMDPPLNPREIDQVIGRWVECKTVKMQKLDDLVRYLQGDVVWFHQFHYLQTLMQKPLLKKYKRLAGVAIYGIEFHHQKQLELSLRKGSTWWIITSNRISNPASANSSDKVLELFLTSEDWYDPNQIDIHRFHFR